MIDIGEVREWAKRSGAMARELFNKVEGRRKQDRSWVTQADEEIETYLRSSIHSRYPDHGILGEEQGAKDIDREYVWAIDPIDGTGVFLAGLPTWCVSIGLLHRSRPYLGVIYLPITEDCYWVDEQEKAYWNGQPIQVSSATHFDSNDWIAVTSRAHASYRIDFPGKTRSLGSVAVSYCYVARGSALGALIGRCSLWDIAAGMAILQAAGGKMVSLQGDPVAPSELLDGSRVEQPIVISTPTLIDELCRYIKVRETRV